MEAEFTTPMMQQYAALKKQYSDCLLFFRLGDFYELFMDDALIGAKVLDITLTGRPRGKDGRIPMAGVPFHAIDTYLSKLVKAGYKVAICEQITEPDKYGIVERDVVRIVTPGTVLDEKSLNQKENNYIIALSYNEKSIGIAAADLSTGEFKTSEVSYTNLEKSLTDLITHIQPSECILAEKIYNTPHILKLLKSQLVPNIFCYLNWEENSQQAAKEIKKHFNILSLEIFNLEQKDQAQIASASLLKYLRETQKDNIGHINRIASLLTDQHMHLDRSTIFNLELLHTIRTQGKHGTLLNSIDETETALGARLLRYWITHPLTDKKAITERHEAVTTYLKSPNERSTIKELLTLIPDIERILARLSVGIGNARDIISLKNALKNILRIKTVNKSFDIPLIQSLNNQIHDELKKIIETIEKTILDEPAFDPKSGGIIKQGVDNDLDSLTKRVTKSKEWIEKLEIEEKERTGISSLKIRFNQVFGFYIEVSKSYINHVPKEYVRKQTLVNGERFITPELKEHEEIILTAEEKINKREYEMYLQTLKQLLSFTIHIQNAAQAVAQIDCLVNFATIAEKNNYKRPTLIDSQEIKIKKGRHPVVERLLEDKQFVPNDIVLNQIEQQLILLTGPNMAGKSVLMRQVALIMLLSQIGSFVPVEEAELCVVDKIFVRSGASDVIASGLSTFMVEMVETAQILNNATDKSLIIMDEIGRGTSTYDGISIAWAIAEYLVTQKNVSSLTLFATHYHELQNLESEYPDKIKNYHMAIEDGNGSPIFLHTLRKGGVEHSFGLAVAKLAGVPHQVIKNAQAHLKNLENQSNAEQVNQESKKQLALSFDATDHLIVQELHQLDIHQMTPLQALNKLSELKNKIKLMQYSNTDIFQAD